MRIMRQILSQSHDMPLVLHQRIIETVFLMSVSEHLCPVSLPDITENPAAVILYLKGYQSAFRSHHQVNLRICAGSPPDIAVMKDSFWVDSILSNVRTVFLSDHSPRFGDVTLRSSRLSSIYLHRRMQAIVMNRIRIDIAISSILIS